jgi:pterin-4a-carbinolamine dehydratase/SAM-dependent methyltransferase
MTLLTNPAALVVPPWILSYDQKSISRSLVALDWIEAMTFLHAIREMIIARSTTEHNDHYPDHIALTNDGELRIVLTTRRAGGLTQMDIDLAASIDTIPIKVSPTWLREQQQSANHDDDDNDTPVVFDKTHFSNGLNGDFLLETAKEKFYFQNGTPGLFEDSEQRDVAAAKHEIVQALCLSEGMIVADVGAGTGLLEPLLSQAVGDTGKVLVSELSPLFRDIITERCQDFPNVVQVMEHPTNRDPKLPTDGTVDVVLLIDVYHHLEYPQSVLRHVRRALRDTHGVLVVLDFHRDPARIKSRDAAWVMQHLRADQATYTREIERAGFVQVQEVNLPALPENYFLVFRKRPIPLSEPGAGWTY